MSGATREYLVVTKRYEVWTKGLTAISLFVILSIDTTDPIDIIDTKDIIDTVDSRMMNHCGYLAIARGGQFWQIYW